MKDSVPGNVLRPVFPLRKELLTSSLVVKNEGTRALQVIGDLAADGERILPGCAYGIDIAEFGGPVQLTFYDGGIQIDSPVESLRSVATDIEVAPGPDDPEPAGSFVIS